MDVRNSYSDPLLQNNLNAEPNFTFTSVPGSTAWRLLCCTEKVATFCPRTGIQWLQCLLSEAENSQVPSTRVSGAQYRDGMGWDEIHPLLKTSMGCRQFSSLIHLRRASPASFDTIEVERCFRLCLLHLVTDEANRPSAIPWGHRRTPISQTNLGLLLSYTEGQGLIN